MKQGKISVQTENIFPIIKKFLYSEHDIFLRELISNAVDACNKMKTLSELGETESILGDLKVSIALDKEAKTITISDTGVGMTEEEIEKYINQVAFSGAEEFVKKYESATGIIGHFGLGFYSAFMVSDKVEIHTLSQKKDSTPVIWTCDGSPEFSISEGTRSYRGTDIVLHLNDESLEFLEAHKISETLNKFCKFLPIPIFFEDKQINNTDPAWTKKPSELTKEDYIAFYKELYPYAEDPLFWIHLNVDYPFNLTGILYFPKISQSYEMKKDKISLYCNQVFVTDEVSDIVPEYLMLLHGVLDSPDIPLNVSRSYLQGDPNVRKINAHISKKVSDKLEELFKTERVEYEAKWDSINLFLKYGMITDDKFLDRVQKQLLFEDATQKNKFYTLEEYKENSKELQTNKEGKLILLYAQNPDKQSSFIQAAKDKNYNVVLLNSLIDPAFINNIEMKWDDVQFKRIDSELLDNLIDKNESSNIVLNEEEQTKLKELFAKNIDGLMLNINIEGLAPDSTPISATQSEWMRRMKEMAETTGQQNFYGSMPNELQIHLNGNSPVIKKLLDSKEDEQHYLTEQLLDLALLSQDMLQTERLNNFIKRNMANLEK